MRIIIPCAGKSSRFPNTRPKYLLTMPDGRMMLQHAADKYLEAGHSVTFVVVKEHSEKYESEYAIRKAYGDAVDVFILDDFTNGPAETVYKVIKDWEDVPFAVNDCDSFFDFNIPVNSNFSVYIDLHNYPTLSHIYAKSFIIRNNNTILDIIEKKISSEFVCVGGYGFASSDEFKFHYKLVKNGNNSEIFISHVMKSMIDSGIHITATEGSNYIDCGTYDSYITHMKKHVTIFCDIDGIIFKNQSKYFKNSYSNPPTINQNAINFIKDKISNGATVIFTTARNIDTKEITEEGIRRAGIENFQVIYGLPHAPRLLINDVHYSNPWPTAIAINAPRNDDDFWKMFN